MSIFDRTVSAFTKPNNGESNNGKTGSGNGKGAAAAAAPPVIYRGPGLYQHDIDNLTTLIGELLNVVKHNPQPPNQQPVKSDSPSTEKALTEKIVGGLLQVDDNVTENARATDEKLTAISNFLNDQILPLLMGEPAGEVEGKNETEQRLADLSKQLSTLVTQTRNAVTKADLTTAINEIDKKQVNRFKTISDEIGKIDSAVGQSGGKSQVKREAAVAPEKNQPGVGAPVNLDEVKKKLDDAFDIIERDFPLTDVNEKVNIWRVVVKEAAGVTDAPQIIAAFCIKDASAKAGFEYKTLSSAANRMGKYCNPKDARYSALTTCIIFCSPMMNEKQTKIFLEKGIGVFPVELIGEMLELWRMNPDFLRSFFTRNIKPAAADAPVEDPPRSKIINNEDGAPTDENTEIKDNAASEPAQISDAGKTVVEINTEAEESQEPEEEEDLSETTGDSDEQTLEEEEEENARYEPAD